MSVQGIDLGSGYEAEPRYHPDGTGELLGVWVIGPAGEQCNFPAEGRCGGWVPVNDGDRGWAYSSEDPLTLTPSIRCGCDVKQPGRGQHGFITNGRWVNAGGIVS